MGYLGFLGAAIAVVPACWAAYHAGRRRALKGGGICFQRVTETDLSCTTVSELQGTVHDLRSEIARQFDVIQRFVQRLKSATADEMGRHNELRRAAEKLMPAARSLSNTLAIAYDDIRRHADTLLAGYQRPAGLQKQLHRREAMESWLRERLALLARYENIFSIAMIGIEKSRKESPPPELVDAVGRLIVEQIRETDLAFQFSPTEFVVGLPETDLTGATEFAARCRDVINRLDIALSFGVTTALGNDCVRTLINRADTARYRAAAEGPNHVCRHTGKTLELVDPKAGWLPVVAAEAEASVPWGTG
jgi:diguanylate cyclase (GGDEF)-like protein